MHKFYNISSMQSWPDIPSDVVDWFRTVFAEANRRVSERLINVPNIREISLDDGLIEAIIPLSAPKLLSSGAIVEMNIHNIGGLRRLGSWETADIAVLVFVYRSGHLLAKKIGLLQSKRLYPKNNDVIDNDPLGFRYGMNAFLNPEPNSSLGATNRQFDFSESCKYGALRAGDDQISVMSKLNGEFGDSLYYLFYNPPSIPSTVRYPVTEYQTVEAPELGCRVYEMSDVMLSLEGLANGSSPTLGALQNLSPHSNWRLETWAADLLLTCKVGQQFDHDREEIVGRLLERRSGPIAAAIAVSIDIPDAQ
jgi:hypothetical protein